MDPRIAAGTTRMLAARDAALDAGAGHLGWKLGFGAPAAMAAFGTDRPLVGFLTRDRLLPSGATVDVGAWTKPVLEAEVAAHLGSDLGPGATPAEALAAVTGWSVAIELADVDVPPQDLEEVLAGNIFHRRVVLGPVVDALPDPLTFTVERDGEVVATTSDPAALTGDLGEILASTATTLATCGASLSAGDVVITGSVVPPIDVTGRVWRVLSGIGEVTASTVSADPGGRR
jgi:2-keto-4-pentenoate hydratase